MRQGLYGSLLAAESLADLVNGEVWFMLVVGKRLQQGRQMPLPVTGAAHASLVLSVLGVEGGGCARQRICTPLAGKLLCSRAPQFHGVRFLPFLRTAPSAKYAINNDSGVRNLER